MGSHNASACVRCPRAEPWESGWVQLHGRVFVLSPLPRKTSPQHYFHPNPHSSMRTPPHPRRRSARIVRKQLLQHVAKVPANALKRKRSRACHASGQHRRCKPRSRVQDAALPKGEGSDWEPDSDECDGSKTCEEYKRASGGGGRTGRTNTVSVTVASRRTAVGCTWSTRCAPLERLAQNVAALPPLPIDQEVVIDVNREALALGRHNLWLFVLLQRYLERGVFQPDEQGKWTDVGRQGGH